MSLPRVSEADVEAAVQRALSRQPPAFSGDEDRTVELYLSQHIDGNTTDEQIEQLLQQFGNLAADMNEYSYDHRARMRRRSQASVVSNEQIIETNPDRYMAPEVQSVVVPVIDVRLARGFELLKELDKGNQGIVFEARVLAMNSHRNVAIKLFAGRTPITSASIAYRNEVLEFENMCGLTHPNIVKVFAASNTMHHGPIIIMDLVPGRSLEYWATQPGHKLTEREAAVVVEHLSDAVRAIHDIGLVHCDLKPANVLGCADEANSLDPAKLRIGDFGLARPRGNVKWSGTAPYMAPERLQNWADEASDLFGLGMLLLFLIDKDLGLTTEDELRLFKLRTKLKDLSKLEQKADSVDEELCHAYKQFITEIQSRIALPPNGHKKAVIQDSVLRAIMLTCLELEGRDRFPSAVALRDDLRPLEQRPAYAGQPLQILQGGAAGTVPSPLSTGRPSRLRCRPGQPVGLCVLGFGTDSTHSVRHGDGSRILRLRYRLCRRVRSRGFFCRGLACWARSLGLPSQRTSCQADGAMPCGLGCRVGLYCGSAPSRCNPNSPGTCPVSGDGLYVCLAF